MKLLFVFIPLLIGTGTVFGQVKSSQYGGAGTAGRSAASGLNWFAGAGIGAQVYFGDHDKQLSLGKRLAPSFDISGGKWLNSSFGVRAGLSGFKMKGLTQNRSHSTGEVFDASRSLEKQSFNFLYAHADLLFNWTNDIYGGYDADRVYHIIPYAGIGWATGLDKPSANNLSPNIGVLQSWKLSANLDFTLDVRGNLLGDGFDGEKGGRNFEGVLATQVGLNYNFR
ncbi:hypothetical protein BWD42_07445 [Sphingobacterium sp. CZ-UAM]|uniref:hypothetical protein n=1 Tax=Sphingobacterium sp. CZ-UAM TaxID=1933868 RepID=UPI0009876237|nr:hypothetical protein [Sphingobacterium sp. CZ-UAM]OOG19729.1 hypothetical protein BWD42_07445 [Sphingobacterium sp. CZ-UAM]